VAIKRFGGGKFDAGIAERVLACQSHSENRNFCPAGLSPLKEAYFRPFRRDKKQRWGKRGIRTCSFPKILVQNGGNLERARSARWGAIFEKKKRKD